MKARTIASIEKLLRERRDQTYKAWEEALREVSEFEKLHGLSAENRTYPQGVSESIRAEYTKLADIEVIRSMEKSGASLDLRDFSDHEWK